MIYSVETEKRRSLCAIFLLFGIKIGWYVRDKGGTRETGVIVKEYTRYQMAIGVESFEFDKNLPLGREVAICKSKD
jgi:hypothetical protein